MHFVPGGGSEHSYSPLVKDILNTVLLVFILYTILFFVNLFPE